jgi:uncharacterized protein (DUF305 family)
MISVEPSDPGTPTSAQGDSTSAYREAHDRMRKAMRVQFSGDADADFLRAMIPHHEGAVEMARVAFDHARDPAVRRLARAVVEIHTAEVALMRRWLKTPTAERDRQC